MSARALRAIASLALGLAAFALFYVGLRRG